MNPFTKAAATVKQEFTAERDAKLVASSTWFTGQNVNEKRNAERRAKRVTSARQCKRQAKALRV